MGKFGCKSIIEECNVLSYKMTRTLNVWSVTLENYQGSTVNLVTIDSLCGTMHSYSHHSHRF